MMVAISPRWNYGLSEVLGINGMQSQPNEADLSKVGIVIDGNQGGFSIPSAAGGNLLNTSIAGVNFCNINFVYPSGSFTASATNLSTDNAGLVNQHVRILACHLIVDFDAAGEIAFNNKILEVTFSLTGVQSGVKEYRDITITTGGKRNQAYGVAYGRDQPFIPFGTSFFAQVSVRDSTNFPANTNIRGAWIGLQRSVGSQIAI